MLLCPGRPGGGDWQGSATWRWPPPVPRQKQGLVLCGADAPRATAQRASGSRRKGAANSGPQQARLTLGSPELSARPPRQKLLLFGCALTQGSFAAHISETDFPRACPTGWRPVLLWLSPLRNPEGVCVCARACTPMHFLFACLNFFLLNDFTLGCSSIDA